MSQAEKKPLGSIKLIIQAGKANPAPPVGPALGQKGLNIMEFCKRFNAETSHITGPVPVVITYFKDKTFTILVKTPPASYLILQSAGVPKGSTEPGKTIVGKITKEQLYKIAEVKIPDMCVSSLDIAVKVLAGTAISMGLEVVD